MKVILDWQEPIQLGEFSDESNYHDELDLKEIPEEAGVYIFYRQFGDTQQALYVGQALNLRNRLKQQFKHLDLMKHIKNSKKGGKYITFALLKTKSKDINHALKQAERALIIQYMGEEKHNLFNKKGLYEDYDVIESIGENIQPIVTSELWTYAR
ncbi:GIY-YIG nuclease family protein [Acinetobacter radioresistens]|uniref:GIY-YIG nuclease family protein n=1 Tax=Acinetobacter radioresistens TaxID=40216 RepID=UPI002245872F|nr:GIY-YIG nuclease family protein [Acinetobacter radioresistens]MCX0335042.1 GIY-YIG nuclease family protein [Acinetobacter radioresistens]